MRQEVAHVLEALGGNINSLGLNTWQLRTLSAIRRCRTAALGGHVDACTDCGSIQISYNSCRNRHCPKCQGHKREQWIQAREADLLPVPYFHVVFTLPEALNPLAMQHPKRVYDALFGAAWSTMQSFGQNKGLQMGMIAVLHTWGQNLCLHPHLHCIVPGGGVGKVGRWHPIRADGAFLFPVKAMSKVFRARYTAALSKAVTLDQVLRKELYKQPWVVYAKQAFGSPNAVVEYLGRYTHKIAISNQRILTIADDTVTFSYKDYKAQGCKKQMSLSHKEFIRRFALHILPKGFVKMRHYGILSSTWKRKKLAILQQQLTRPQPKAPQGLKLRKCPCCKTGTLVTIEVFGSRGPPAHYIGGGHNPFPQTS